LPFFKDLAPNLELPLVVTDPDRSIFHADDCASLQKKPVFARMGIKELWIIDPDREEATVYRFDQDPAEPVKKLREHGALSSPLLPGLRIALQDIFRRG
jgi:Uma2 family endonuclease